MSLEKKLAIVCFCTFWVTGAAAEPVRIIFDTDKGNDVDDALALAMLHAFESRAEAKLLGVTVTKDYQWSAPYVDLVNHFYGRGWIPVGVVKYGKTPEESRMIRVPAEKASTSRWPFTLSSTHHRWAQGARRCNPAPPHSRCSADGSVVFVQVGFSTNLARLLDSAPDGVSPLAGRNLVSRKVRLLSIMAGEFVEGFPEYNVRIDIPSATKVFSEWPSPIVASGFEIGKSILFPARSIATDVAYVKNHPIADAYRNYRKMPYNQPTWDLPLYFTQSVVIAAISRCPNQAGSASHRMASIP